MFCRYQNPRRPLASIEQSALGAIPCPGRLLQEALLHSAIAQSLRGLFASSQGKVVSPMT